MWVGGICIPMSRVSVCGWEVCSHVDVYVSRHICPLTPSSLVSSAVLLVSIIQSGPQGVVGSHRILHTMHLCICKQQTIVCYSNTYVGLVPVKDIHDCRSCT